VSALAPAVVHRFTDFPLSPPRGLHPAHGAEAAVTIAAILVFLCLLAVVARYARCDRELIGVLIMVGAVIAVVNDPLVEVAGRCFFYTKLPVFNTMGRQMPLWGPFAYGILFGTETFLLYRLAAIGRLDLRRLRLIIASTFLLDIAIEIPALQTHVYVYYGLQPFKLAGFPLYWVFINTPAVVFGAALLHRQRHWFTGPRRLAALLVPVLAVPTAFYTAGLPVLVAMNTTLPSAWVWMAAVLTAGLSLLIMDAAGRVLCAPLPVPGDPHGAPAPVAAGSGPITVVAS
jgi:hypothetical protein